MGGSIGVPSVRLLELANDYQRRNNLTLFSLGSDDPDERNECFYEVKGIPPLPLSHINLFKPESRRLEIKMPPPSLMDRRKPACLQKTTKTDDNNDIKNTESPTTLASYPLVEPCYMVKPVLQTYATYSTMLVIFVVITMLQAIATLLAAMMRSKKGFV